MPSSSPAHWEERVQVLFVFVDQFPVTKTIRSDTGHANVSNSRADAGSQSHLDWPSAHAHETAGTALPFGLEAEGGGCAGRGKREAVAPYQSTTLKALSVLPAPSLLLLASRRRPAASACTLSRFAQPCARGEGGGGGGPAGRSKLRPQELGDSTVRFSGRVVTMALRTFFGPLFRGWLYTHSVRLRTHCWHGWWPEHFLFNFLQLSHARVPPPLACMEPSPPPAPVLLWSGMSTAPPTVALSHASLSGMLIPPLHITRPLSPRASRLRPPPRCLLPARHGLPRMCHMREEPEAERSQMLRSSCCWMHTWIQVPVQVWRTA
eukprot:SAG22_NODE_511_length_9594_cov_4.553449_5_plen_321_part_00